MWGGGGGEGKGGIATGARVFAFRWRAGLLVLREPSAFWLPGPGAALLFFAERRRRRRDLSNGSRGCCEMEWVRGVVVVSEGQNLNHSGQVRSVRHQLVFISINYVDLY